jgi:hypothetical protein
MKRDRGSVRNTPWLKTGCLFFLDISAIGIDCSSHPRKKESVYMLMCVVIRLVGVLELWKKLGLGARIGTSEASKNVGLMVDLYWL